MRFFLKITLENFADIFYYTFASNVNGKKEDEDDFLSLLNSFY